MWSDRIKFVIPWDRFPKGASVFIPALDLQYTAKAVLKEAKEQNAEISTRIVVENGVMGVRIWRTD
jgi:hypothetical protein